MCRRSSCPLLVLSSAVKSKWLSVQAGLLQKCLPGWSIFKIWVTSRWLVASKSMSTLQVGQQSCCEMGGRTRGLLAKAITKAMDFWEENTHMDFDHTQGRVLVPSPSCTVGSLNTAFWLQPKDCNNQSLLISGCNILRNGQVVMVTGEKGLF